jgi:hypothetical protein
LSRNQSYFGKTDKLYQLIFILFGYIDKIGNMTSMDPLTTDFFFASQISFSKMTTADAWQPSNADAADR